MRRLLTLACAALLASPALAAPPEKGRRARRAASSKTREYKGFYGEVVRYPATHSAEQDRRGAIEIVRFYPEGASVPLSAFNDPEKYEKLGLMQLLVIPIRESGVADIQEVRRKKLAELSSKGLDFRVQPARAFLPGSFFVVVNQPYSQVHAYIKGKDFYFTVLAGRIDALFKAVVDGLVPTAKTLEMPEAKPEAEAVAAPAEPPKPAEIHTNDPREFAKRMVVEHVFSIDRVNAAKLKVPVRLTIGQYLDALAAYMAQERGAKVERTWRVEKVKEDLYRVRHTMKALEDRFFKKKRKFRWTVDLRSHRVEGENDRSRAFFLGRDRREKEKLMDGDPFWK